MESLVGFTINIEYNKKQENAFTGALSWITLRLDAETMKSILNGITVGTIGRANANGPVMAEADEEIHKEVQETAVKARASHVHVNLHVTELVATQQEVPYLRLWSSAFLSGMQDLKHLLGDNNNK